MERSVNIKCPDYVLKALCLLKLNGYDAYIVGGCVRDSVMGKSANDWDMTTDAMPQQIIDVFCEYKTIPTGIKHGTVTIVIDSHQIEITTMRIDGNYSDSRHPDSVRFTDKIENDLARRDFTVNAIAYNPDKGIIDPFGGINDIENNVIRCVGTPDKRFREDALRILRALRFSSTLGFKIEKGTAQSINNNSDLLCQIANERIRVELLKMLCGKNIERVLTKYSKVIFTIIPELEKTSGFDQCTPYHIYDVWTHIVKVTSAVENDPLLRMSALLHDVAKPDKFTIDRDGIGHFKGHAELGAEQSEIILRRLRFSKKEIKTICSIIRIHDERPNGNKVALAHLCSENSVETVKFALKLMKADAYGKNPEILQEYIKIFSNTEKQLNDLIQENVCLSISDLDIKGTDLIKIGIERPQISIVLKELLNLQIDGKVLNKKSELERQAIAIAKIKFSL